MQTTNCPCYVRAFVLKIFRNCVKVHYLSDGCIFNYSQDVSCKVLLSGLIIYHYINNMFWVFAAN
jgi:hypothetical protein